MSPAPYRRHLGSTTCLKGASLNATDAELEGILSPTDRAKAAQKSENAIAGLERLDRAQADPENAVLVVGSIAGGRVATNPWAQCDVA